MQTVHPSLLRPASSRSPKIRSSLTVTPGSRCDSHLPNLSERACAWLAYERLQEDTHKSFVLDPTP